MPKKHKPKISKRQKLQELIYEISSDCWVCGELAETKHHSPPRCINPKNFIKIPICRKCHKKVNGVEYTKRQERTLRSNIKKIERSVKNIRDKLLD